MTKIANKYTYHVIWDEEDHQHIGICDEFPSLSHFAASPGEALSGIIELVADVIVDMISSNEKVPYPGSRLATRRSRSR